MASIVQIKRSTSGNAPNTTILAEAELAYSQDKTNDGANAILYIESVDSGSNQVIHKVGGKYYTDIIDRTPWVPAFAQANVAFAQANVAINQANVNFSESNTKITVSFNQANVAFAQANVAINQANVNFGESNTKTSVAFNQANVAFAQANTAFAGANIAYNIANKAIANVLAGTGISVTGYGASQPNVTVALTNTNVSAGSYGGATNGVSVIIDAQGRITSAANTAVSSILTIAGNSGTDTVTLGTDTLTVRGVAPGISTAVTDNTISITNTGVSNIAGTANQITVNQGTGNVTISLPNDVSITNDLTVGGNLYILGDAVTLTTSTITIEDPLVKFGNVVNPTDSLDIGFYGQYTSGGTKYAGLYRDHADSGIFKLFKDLSSDPTTNVVTEASYTLATLKANLTGGNITSLVNAIAVNSGGTGRKTLTANAVLYGDGTNAVALATGTAGQVLQIGTDGMVAFGSIDGGTY